MPRLLSRTTRLLDPGVRSNRTSRELLGSVPRDSVVQVLVPHRLVRYYSDESPSTWFAVDQAPKDVVLFNCRKDTASMGC